MKKSNLFVLPNIITLIRLILLIPIFWLLLQNQRLFALALILVAGISDFLDGFIARKWNLQSDAGRIIDPVVDKISLIGLMLFLVFSENYSFPLWFLMVVVFRESMVLLFSFIFIESKKIVLESSAPGKISAFATGIPIILSILNLYLIMWIVIWMALILNIYSTLVYLNRFRRSIKHYENDKNRKQSI